MKGVEPRRVDKTENYPTCLSWSTGESPLMRTQPSEGPKQP